MSGSFPVPGESAEVHDLRVRSDAVRAMVADQVSGSPGPDLRYLAGWPEIVGCLRDMEPRVHRSVWVLQPRYFYDPEDPGVELTQGMTARGVESMLITRPASVPTHPLLPSIYPNTRLAPVFLRSLVGDERELIVEGLDTAEGQRTAWHTTRAPMVEAVLDVWRRTRELSTPLLPPGAEPPLTRRQLEVARLLAVGEKDLSIARLLDLSARTVEREVRVILSTLGAGSRTEAVLIMRGRGVNGGGPGV